MTRASCNRILRLCAGFAAAWAVLQGGDRLGQRLLGGDEPLGEQRRLHVDGGDLHAVRGGQGGQQLAHHIGSHRAVFTDLARRRIDENHMVVRNCRSLVDRSLQRDREVRVTIEGLMAVQDSGIGQRISRRHGTDQRQTCQPSERIHLEGTHTPTPQEDPDIGHPACPQTDRNTAHEDWMRGMT